MMNCWKWCLGLLYGWGSAMHSLLLLLSDHFLPQRPSDSSPSPIPTVLLPSSPQCSCSTCLGSTHISTISRRQAENVYFPALGAVVWMTSYSSVVFISPLGVQCFALINPKCFLVSSRPCYFHLLGLQYMLFPFSCGPFCCNVTPKYCGMMPERSHPSEVSPQDTWRSKFVFSWFRKPPATQSLGLASKLWREGRWGVGRSTSHIPKKT